MRIKNLGEFSLIERLAKDIKTSARVIAGIGDDAAVLRYARDKYLLFTSDMLVEGRHFHKKTDPYLVGKKSLSVNISDIAAMGGVPRFAVVSLGVPPSLDLKYVDALYKGIRDAARRFRIDLVGGDTVASEKIVINVSLLGEVEKKNLVLRSGAKQGDAIFVTGVLGGSLKGKHLDFIPRLEEARFLVKNFNINSMIDVSDGLFSDLDHILKSSRKGALVYEKAVPISKHAKDFKSAVRDGEDFELVFTMPRAEGRKLVKKWPFKTRLSEIGKVCKDRRKITGARGYTHF